MLYNLLCLIVLALIANQSKRPVLAGILFGLLKAIGLYFAIMASPNADQSWALQTCVIELVTNGLLGFAIAYLTIKHSKSPKLLIVTTLFTFLTFMTDFWILQALDQGI